MEERFGVTMCEREGGSRLEVETEVPAWAMKGLRVVGVRVVDVRDVSAAE